MVDLSATDNRDLLTNKTFQEINFQNSIKMIVSH